MTYKIKYTGKILNGKSLFDDIESFKKKISELEGHNFELTIDFLQEQRSTQWNKYYWKVIVDSLCEATGNDPDTVHTGLKKKYLRQIIRCGEKGRIIPDTTTCLSNREFAQYCRLIRIGEADICIIPEPNEVIYD